jgi:L,D-transpeptidase YcbB
LGLKNDGVAGPATIKELNIPVTDRIKQVLVNMERMRWMPKHGEGKRLVANIPEFKLPVFEGNQHVFDMNIVVGKSANKTVIFNDKLEHVVFSPYWNIPRSIVRNEILPSIERNPQYLAANNMEQTGSSGGLPVIRQKPGPGNALGKVKFIFPNSYSIYFHDTPSKSLFERNQRAFSHGCIRLAEPEKLARYLLKEKGWSDARISSAMNSGKEQWVRSNPVDVVISYFTAWVDNDGILNFRNDIYGHDKELANRLFED